VGSLHGHWIDDDGGLQAVEKEEGLKHRAERAVMVGREVTGELVAGQEITDADDRLVRQSPQKAQPRLGEEACRERTTRRDRSGAGRLSCGHASDADGGVVAAAGLTVGHHFKGWLIEERHDRFACPRKIVELVSSGRQSSAKPIGGSPRGAANCLARIRPHRPHGLTNFWRI